MSAAPQSKPRPLSLLVATLRYPPYVAGGYELLTRDAVVALRERGHRVEVIAGRGARLEGEVGLHPVLEPCLDAEQDLFQRSFRGSNRERFGLHFYSRANAHATRRVLEESGAELLFYFNLGLVSLAPLVAARRMGLPSLGYISDPWPLNHWLLAWRSDPRQRRKRLRLWLLERVWAFLSARVGYGRLLTCSDHLRGRLSAGGVAGATLGTLHLGVPPDMERLAAHKPAPARAAGEPLRIACISSFWEGKGQDCLLGALEQLKLDGVEFIANFAGAGGGAYLETLRARARALGGVEFLQGLEREGISELLASSHVLVVPSVWDEPFPLATLEGLVHGCAVLLSDAGGSPEAIEDGVHGRVFAAGDARALGAVLSEWAADEPLRRTLGAAGRERARGELSHAAFVDGLERELYAAVEARP